MTRESRQQRRARERREAKAAGRQPVIIAGAGIVAAELPGHTYEARPHAQLPAKVPGKHRWIATGAWVMSEEAVTGARDPDLLKFLDSENLMNLSLGCWDCERPLGAIEPGSPCPAPGD